MAWTSRYEYVSRRALLRASAALGVAAILPACGNGDANVFAGASTDLAPTPTPEPIPTTPQLTTPEPTATVEPTATPEPTAETEPPTEAPASPTAEAASPTAPTAEPTPAESGEPTPFADDSGTASPLAAVQSAVITFTYTQGAGGKNEQPYVAVWLENTSGELLETVALFYEQGRRGARWLDHLLRWWDVDQERIRSGGADTASTISSATRAAGTYTVAWDGFVSGQPAPAGDYVLCIEAAREEGPYSLSCQTLTLSGTAGSTALPDDGELHSASAVINV